MRPDVNGFTRIVFIVFFASTGFGEEPGKLIEKVVCKANSNRSYTLYLPSKYPAERKWPILYCFDARGNGKLPAERFQEAAEKYGYIVASSNDTRSDDSNWPNGDAIKAIVDDTRARFAIDPNEFLSKKDYARAAFVLTFAAEIKDQSPRIWYKLACAHALSGNKKKAIESLAHAVDSGFTDVEHIKNDPDLNSIRGEKAYQEIVTLAD